jgi:hypothetical protein
MRPRPVALLVLPLAALLALLVAFPATPQQQVPPRPAPVQPGLPQPIRTPQGIKPTLLPVAETKLLMNGLALPNFKGMERLLQEKPADPEAWTFARGQALLIAETANLLMLRPPKGKGQDVWFDNAMKLRQVSSELAQATSNQDYLKSRQLLVGVANRCNACHTSFRVPVEIAPFAQK